jgi:hypothetical protein
LASNALCSILFASEPLAHSTSSTASLQGWPYLSADTPSDVGDPAFLRILAKSERYKLRYDAAKQSVPRVEVL